MAGTCLVTIVLHTVGKHCSDWFHHRENKTLFSFGQIADFLFLYKGILVSPCINYSMLYP